MKQIKTGIKTGDKKNHDGEDPQIRRIAIDNPRSSWGFDWVSFTEIAFVLTIMVIMVLMSISMVSDLKTAHNEVTSNSYTDLLHKGLPIAHNKTDINFTNHYRVYTFRDQTECFNVNKQKYRSTGKTRSVFYTQFHASCDTIMNRIYDFHYKYNKDKARIFGLSVFKGKDVERYYPVYKNEKGELVYLGGIPATYDFIEVSKDINSLGYNIDMFNDSYRMAGVQ
ncbi:hypothetical protein D051_0584 [Vibrio parahaemolyticus VPCR-2010]|uniref:hypothetical protein n=1 Tax=Vibrio parahaemolyticus TaxID=670 RepID=UPI00038E6A3C|nr:hypothetical protein D051_0584 [Vibrio parahaemolyticus VPCR-2010]